MNPIITKAKPRKSAKVVLITLWIFVFLCSNESLSEETWLANGGQWWPGGPTDDKQAPGLPEVS